MVKVETKLNDRVCQGDIYKNIEFIEYAEESKGIIEISKINFPLVIVLTQDCDLEQDHNYRQVEPQKNLILSVIVAPLYNAEHVYFGKHLSELDIKMPPIKKDKTPGKFLRNNERIRYHYLEFPENISIVSSIVDFKHYFTVNVNYLMEIKKTNFVCKVKELYREDISQRFASFLSRVGLPTSLKPIDKKVK